MIRSPTGKTPEELALENENLRASLDALAVHSHAVETENKALRTDLEERTKAMKTAINEVRREVGTCVSHRASSWLALMFRRKKPNKGKTSSGRR